VTSRTRARDVASKGFELASRKSASVSRCPSQEATSPSWQGPRPRVVFQRSELAQAGADLMSRDARVMIMVWFLLAEESKRGKEKREPRKRSFVVYVFVWAAKI